MQRYNPSEKRGEQQRQKLVKLLQESPKSTKELCKLMNFGRPNLMKHLERLQKEKRVYVHGHIAQWGRPAAIYAAGNLPDVEYVPQSRPGHRPSKAQRIDQILTLLSTRGMSSKQIGAAIFVSPAHVLKFLRVLRDPACRQIHIAKWRHPQESGFTSGGDWTPVYRAGDKPDAPKPRRESSSERHRRLSQNSEYREARNKERVLRYRVERTRNKPQGIFAALGL